MVHVNLYQTDLNYEQELDVLYFDSPKLKLSLSSQI